MDESIELKLCNGARHEFLMWVVNRVSIHYHYTLITFWKRNIVYLTPEFGTVFIKLA